MLSFLLVAALQENFSSLAEDVRTMTLENGLRIVVLPVGEAPVVAFHMHVQVGAVDEEPGKTGLAHFSEHMAFKGSAYLGSRDWPRERAAMAQADAAWLAYEQTMARASEEFSTEDVAELLEEFLALEEEAVELGDPGAFDRAVENLGGLDQNASTGADSTDYFVTLPSNQIEAWFWLARQQFGGPVMREFYAERDVVSGEMREGPESNPTEAGLDALVATAFRQHPYRDPVLGYRTDLERLDRPEMLAFWRRHYTADRMVLAVVGRVDPALAMRLAQDYLGDLPAGKEPRNSRVPEPMSHGPREASVEWDVAPQVLVGWRIPSLLGRSAWIHAALGDLLFEGPAARVPEKLLVQDRLVSRLDWGSGLPGELDSNLMAVLFVPVSGVATTTCVSALQGIVDEFARHGPSDAEMTGVRRRLEMSFLEGVQERSELAAALAWAEAEETQGWGSFFASLALIRSLKAAEIRQAAQALDLARRVTVRVGKPEPIGMVAEDLEEAGP